MQESTQYETALYGRTSKDDPRAMTIEIQQATLREWSQRDPFVSHVNGEYWDEGVSGKIPLAERPAGRRLLDDIESGKVQAVAVVYIDRFGRTLLAGLQAAAALEERGVKLVAVNDGWDARRDDNPLYFQFKMMLAEDEHRRIVARMTDGKRRAMGRDNAPPGGPLTFGYRMDPSGRYVPDQVEAPIVIRIFEMALSRCSHSEILRWVKNEGVPAGRKFQKRLEGSRPAIVGTHREAIWHLTKVGKILANRTYIGERRWGERVFPCPALVDPASFDRVQAMLADKSRTLRRGRRNPEKGILSGLFKCGLCGTPFYHKANTIHRENGTVDRYEMYVCDSLRRNRGCHAKMVRVAEVDREVWGIIQGFLEEPEAIVRKLLAADARLEGTVAEADQAEAELHVGLAAVDDQVAAVWAEQRARKWPMAWVSPRLDDLNAERQRIEAQIAEVRRRRASLTMDKEQAARVTAAVASIRARLAAGLSAAEKAEIARMMVADGKIHTVGSGRRKTARVEFNLLWGETVDRNVPKDCSYGTLRYTPVCLEIGRVAV